MDERTLAEYAPKVRAALENRAVTQQLRAISKAISEYAPGKEPFDWCYVPIGQRETIGLIERRIEELDQEFAAL